MVKVSQNPTLSPIFLLLPTSSQKDDLRLTLACFNRGSQYVRDAALELDLLNKVAIQPHVYNRLRTEFRLPSQIAVRAISNGVELAKSYVLSYSPQWRNRKNRLVGRPDENIPAVSEHAPMQMDDLIVSYPNPFYTSIRTIIQRDQIAMRFCEYAKREDNAPFSVLHCDNRCSTGEVFWVHLPPMLHRQEHRKINVPTGAGFSD